MKRASLPAHELDVEPLLGSRLVGQQLVESARRKPGQPLNGVGDLCGVTVGSGAPVVLIEVDERSDQPLRQPEPFERAADGVVGCIRCR